VGQRHIAWAAFERAHRLADRYWPDPRLQTFLREHCRKRQAELQPEFESYRPLADALLKVGNEKEWLATWNEFLQQEDYGLTHARARVTEAIVAPGSAADGRSLRPSAGHRRQSVGCARWLHRHRPREMAAVIGNGRTHAPQRSRSPSATPRRSPNRGSSGC
jgi:hypothetical protein